MRGFKICVSTSRTLEDLPAITESDSLERKTHMYTVKNDLELIAGFEDG